MFVILALIVEIPRLIELYQIATKETCWKINSNA